MFLEIKSKKIIGFLEGFASLLGTDIKNGRINIPEDKGYGYIRFNKPNSKMRILIGNYKLNEELIILQQAPSQLNDLVILGFYNVFQSKEEKVFRNIEEKMPLPYLQIGTENFGRKILVPKNTHISSIMIVVDVPHLKELLHEDESHLLIKDILSSNSQPVLLEACISPYIQKIATELVETDLPKNLQNFYSKVKAEELICMFFAELMKRENAHIRALHKEDVEKIYEIKNKMLMHLNSPPILSELALLAGMSKSKFKRLFKQILGSSIFNYYQNFRMQEAASLLKNKGLAVAEVGHKMGFTNLSHFSRVFEKHIGLKPKKYSVMG